MSRTPLVLIASAILVLGAWVWLNIAGVAQSRQLRGKLAFWLRVRALAGLSAASAVVLIASDFAPIAIKLSKEGAIVGVLLSGAIFILALIRVIQIQGRDFAATCTAAIDTSPTSANGGVSCSVS